MTEPGGLAGPVGQWPDRVWAVEGANGVGRPVAGRLLADAWTLTAGVVAVVRSPRRPAEGQGFTAAPVAVNDVLKKILAADRLGGISRA